jgi:o-succinylbenzoate---CoA ligase
MPHLIYREHKIKFATIRKEEISDLPAEMRAAAQLIADWNAGQGIFEIQTSGSTGKPKTIVLNRDKIIYSAKQTAAAFGLEAGDTLFCCLGLQYIAGFMMVMRAVVLDCNLIIAEPSSHPLLKMPTDIRIDFASFIPLQMETMLQDEEAVVLLNKMKAILVGGGPVSEKLEAKIQRLSVPVYHTYAMTETYTHVATRVLNTINKELSYKPLNGVTVSQDERGCLVIHSFLTDYQPLATNDLAEIHADGSFTLQGRFDNVIISGGIKIQLEKIEAECQAVFDASGINPCFFAAGIPDEKLGKMLVLVIEGDQWDAEVIHKFNTQLSQKLGRFELPKKYLFVEKILTTTTGKLDRIRTLKEMIENGNDRQM